MPNMYMTIGVPGSGKSWWIKHLDSLRTAAILSSDNYIESVARHLSMESGQTVTYSHVFHDYITEAEKQLQLDLKHAIEDNLDIVWDQTNLSAATRRKKLQKIPKHYKKIACVFSVPGKEQHDLWLNSPHRNGKVISNHIMASMIATFQHPSIDEGFNEIIFPGSVLFNDNVL